MAMDAERRQAELIGQFSAQAAALSSAPQLAALVLEATSHPALFAFSELLTLPALSKVLHRPCLRPPPLPSPGARRRAGVRVYFSPSGRLGGVRLDLTCCVLVVSFVRLRSSLARSTRRRWTYSGSSPTAH
jgi:hypothetical protein